MFGKLSLFKKGDSNDSAMAEGGEVFKYCPSCGDEYRAEIIRCVACDVELVFRNGSRSPGTCSLLDSRELIKISAGDDLALIKRGRLADVKELKRLLEKARIDSIIVGEEAGCAGGCCNSAPFDLHVRAKDFADAQEVLEQEFRRTTGLAEHDFSASSTAAEDHRSGTVQCPACMCSFAPDGDTVCPDCGLCF